MAKSEEYVLKTPSELTKKRVEEIRFYLFINLFLNKYGKNSVFASNLVELLCNAYGIRTVSIMSAIDNMNAPTLKPSKKDIAVAIKHLNIPIRPLLKTGVVSIGNYYKSLLDYIREDEPALEPVFDELVYNDIVKFMDNSKFLFEEVSYIVRNKE